MLSSNNGPSILLVLWISLCLKIHSNQGEMDRGFPVTEVRLEASTKTSWIPLTQAHASNLLFGFACKGGGVHGFHSRDHPTLSKATKPLFRSIVISHNSCGVFTFLVVSTGTSSCLGRRQAPILASQAHTFMVPN